MNAIDARIEYCCSCSRSLTPSSYIYQYRRCTCPLFSSYCSCFLPIVVFLLLLLLLLLLLFPFSYFFVCQLSASHLFSSSCSPSLFVNRCCRTSPIVIVIVILLVLLLFLLLFDTSVYPYDCSPVINSLAD